MITGTGCPDEQEDEGIEADEGGLLAAGGSNTVAELLD